MTTKREDLYDNASVTDVYQFQPTWKPYGDPDNSTVASTVMSILELTTLVVQFQSWPILVRGLVAIVLLSLFADAASACNRCGVFGSRCRFRAVQRVVAVEKVVQQVAVPQQVINVSNVYPAGQTQYVAGTASALYSANADLAIAAAARVADNAVSSLTSSITAGLAGNYEVAQVAKLHAAVEHLRTAVGQTGPQSLDLRITQSGGGLRVEEFRPPEMPVPPAEQLNGAAANSVLSTRCAKCHGLSLASPKAGIYLDAGHELDSEVIVRALDMVRLGKMPPQGEQPLTQQEKERLMEELLTQRKK